ncbi:hypothetical protein D0Z03_000125 [Geotrichum reessii]|nr:hypothetical protein D0Z03_000125 [Galactomyces reessii]
MYRSYFCRASSTARHYSTKPPISFYALFPKTFPAGAPPTGPYKDIPTKALKLEYYNLQRDHHPDHHQDNNGADSSAHISVAYRTLLDPLRRAQHILATRGFDPLAEDAAKAVKDDDDDNTDMLMDVMMMKEAIYDATAVSELADVQAETSQHVEELVDALDTAFKDDNLVQASKLVTRLSYWDGIMKQLHEKLGELEQSE